ncbi:MAG TPA: hypothetical protein VFE84_13610 [Patescibacteria group bacterium]|nr:hypothetical protein [Patescibacteria group bacterium]
MTRLDCERALRHLADPLAGPPDEPVRQHLHSCASCAGEMRAFRAVLEAAADFRQSDVPDPGEPYWNRFLPSVRARIALRQDAGMPSERHPRRIAAAAVLLMILAAYGALILHPPAPGPDGAAGSVRAGASLDEAGRRVDDALRRMPAASGEVAADMLGLDPFQEIGAGEILDAMKEIERPPSLSGSWAGLEDDELERLLDRLDLSQTLELRAELAAEKS